MAARGSIAPFGTILDYIHWRGDLSFEADPWNDIDSLIAAQISYANFGENERTFGNPQRFTFADIITSGVLLRYPQKGLGYAMKFRGDLLESLPDAARFRDIRLLDQVNDTDPDRDIQFSAMTLQVPGVGIVVAFRGTDPTLVGWKEDFMMSYASPVPAQAAAAAYLENAAAQTEGDLILTGHSKGGNLSLYAASHASPQVRARLRAVCSFDGPGLDDETLASEGFRSIVPLIHSVIPEDSVVGLLMSYHQVYRVVQSTASSLFQHEPATWKLIGREFVEQEEVSLQSQVIDQTMHEWLTTCSMAQREIFVNTVFSMFDKKERREDPAADSDREMDEMSRQMVMSLLHRLAGNTWSARVKKPLEQAAEGLRNRLRGDLDTRFKSDVIRIDNRGNGFKAAEEETKRTAAFTGMSRKDATRLQLFTEEMMSMMHTVAGEVNGSFWIEREGPRYDLNLTTKAVLDRQTREMLIASSTSRKNEAAKSFLGRLRNAFEQAMASERDDMVLDLPAGAAARTDAQAGWDRYEQSVLLRLADNVRVAIRGGTVSVTVTKVFDAPAKAPDQETLPAGALPAEG